MHSMGCPKEKEMKIKKEQPVQHTHQPPYQQETQTNKPHTPTHTPPLSKVLVKKKNEFKWKKEFYLDASKSKDHFKKGKQ